MLDRHRAQNISPVHSHEQIPGKSWNWCFMHWPFTDIFTCPCGEHHTCIRSQEVPVCARTKVINISKLLYCQLGVVKANYRAPEQAVPPLGFSCSLLLPDFQPGSFSIALSLEDKEHEVEKVLFASHSHARLKNEQSGHDKFCFFFSDLSSRSLSRSLVGQSLDYIKMAELEAPSISNICLRVLQSMLSSLSWLQPSQRYFYR